MTIDQLKDFFEGFQLGDKGQLGSLRHLAFVIGENEYKAAQIASKEKVISLLGGYYSAPNRFQELWEGLSDAERKIISVHIWSKGSEPLEYADEVAREFGLAENQERPYYYYYASNSIERFKRRYAHQKSKLWLLFPANDEINIFLDEIRETVGEMKRVYTKVPGKLLFASRENRVNDFANIVRFSNANKLKLNNNGSLSKASAMKLITFCGYEEYASAIGTNPEDVRKTEHLLVTFPLLTLCTVGGLLTNTEGALTPHSKSVSLLSLPFEQLVKKLFDAYLKSKTFDEISLLGGMKTKRGHYPFEARQNLVAELQHCPINRPVYTKELERHIRIVHKGFARKTEKHVVYPGKTAYHDYPVGWDSYEHRLIQIILIFFSALGMVDIAWGNVESHYDGSGRRVPDAFRINPLGAYVFGRKESYTSPAAAKVQNSGGFTVLPDYTIVVPDSPDRLRHELYFEKLFSKVSATDQVSIFKLDFETVVRALNSGASVASLRKYLTASDKPVPGNIARALADWEKQTGRIKLRQVTILECDSAALLEEVIRYKGMGEWVLDKIPAAVVVDGDATGKIKKTIEKNKRFCKDVI